MRLFFSVGTLLIGAAQGWGAEPPAGAGTSDPPPPGATVRLGISRFAAAGPVEHVAFSPDGRLIAATWQLGERNGPREVAIYDAATGRLLRKMPYRGYYLRQLRFVGDGKGLVGGGTWWDPATGKVIRSGDNRGARTIRHDGRRWVFSGSKYGIVYFQDPIADRRIATVAVKTKVNGYEQFVFSPGGEFAAGSTYDGQLHLYSGDDGKHLRALQLGEKGIASLLAFSPDERWLAAAGRLKKIRVYEVATGKLVAELPGHKDREDVTALRFTPDGRYLASAGDDRIVRFWDVEAGEDVHVIHTGIDFVPAIDFSPGGKRLVTGGRMGSWTNGYSALRLWDVASTEPMLEAGRARGRYDRLTFSSDGRWLAAANRSGSIDVFRTKSGKRLLSLQGAAGHDLRFSPDNWRLIATSRGTYSIWQMPTGRQLIQSPGQVAYNAAESRVMPDGKHLACIAGNKVLLLDLKSGEVVRELVAPKEKSPFGAMTVTPDGKTLAVTQANRNRNGNDGIYIFDAASGEYREWVEVNILRKDYEHTSILERPQISADGSLLAAWVRYSPYGLVCWDVESRRQVHHLSNVTRTAIFSHDGKYLVDFQDGELVLLELATGKLALRRRLTESAVAEGGPFGSRRPAAATFVGHHASPLSAITMSNDGKTLAAAMTASRTVALWSVHDPDWKDYPPGGPLSAERLNQLWADLAETDAARAYRALWTLAAVPKQSEPVVARHLAASQKQVADREAINQLLARLVGGAADERDAARDKVLELGGSVEPLVRAKLKRTADDQQRRRLQVTLDVLQSPVQHAAGEPLRRIRLVQLLEKLASDRAVVLLKQLAGDSPTAREARDAKAALQRMESAQQGP